MKVTLVMVISLDGKTTKSHTSSIYEWTSWQDQDFFFTLVRKSNLIVMGAKTYEAARKLIKLDSKILRVVLTKNPQKYEMETVDGQLEFSKEQPTQLVKRLSQKGYKTMLLVGGSEISSLFLNNNLIDEFFLTIEPAIFGVGNSMFSQIELNKKLKLLDFKKLNAQGSLLLHYTILN